MQPGEKLTHGVEPGWVQVEGNARALGVGPLHQPRVAEFVSIFT